MIRINKTANIPQVLSTAGAGETTNLINNYTAYPNDYTSRAGVAARQIIKMDFDSRLYGDASVKEQLISEQHDKCCFCEAKFSDNSYGDVEHYRPKKAYKKRGARSFTYPGYYWLAYNWNNLMFSCEKCNRKYKRNDFPLNNETTRKPYDSHPNLLENEDRLLINPLEEDPSAFIEFHDEVPVPRNGSLKGVTSIHAYGLERLNNSRLEYLILLEALLAFVEIDINNNAQINIAIQMFNFTRVEVIEKVIQANTFFNSAAKDTAKFAHCVRCKFPQLPII